MDNVWLVNVQNRISPVFRCQSLMVQAVMMVRHVLRVIIVRVVSVRPVIPWFASAKQTRIVRMMALFVMV